MMAIPIVNPEVDFGWISKLPVQWEQAQLKRKREQTLADLDYSDPNSLQTAASRLAGLGDLESLKASEALSGIAQKRIDAARDAGLLKMLIGAGGGGEPPAGPVGPAGPAVGPRGPITPGDIPPQPPQGGATISDVTSIEPMPPQPGPTPAQRVAQGFVISPQQQQAGMAAAIAGGPGIRGLGQKVFELGATERQQAIRDREKARLDTEGKIEEMDYKRLIDYQKEMEDKSAKARSSLNTISAMERIMDSPEFISGHGAAWLAKYGSSTLAIAEVAERMGFKGTLARFQSIRDPVARMEAFRALSNTLIKESLGTLGNQISEGDRRFVELAYPSLELSKEGNALLLKIYRATLQRDKEIGDITREYGGRSPRELARRINDYKEKNSLFGGEKNRTSLGKEVESLRERQGEGGQPRAPMTTPDGGQIIRNDKTGEQFIYRPGQPLQKLEQRKPNEL